MADKPDRLKGRSGWGWPLNARKAHFFHEDIISLCRKWMYSGVVEPLGEGTPIESKDDCVICTRKLADLNLVAEH